MANELPSLGELEIGVLRMVWQHQPCSERQITELIQQEREVGRTTVLKTMQRLEAKGLLVRVPGEGPVRFRAALEEGRVLPTLVGRFVDHVLGGSPEPLVAYLADAKKLSRTDIQVLKAIIRKLSGYGYKPKNPPRGPAQDSDD
jgi:predicted transcriptional regulator